MDKLRIYVKGGDGGGASLAQGSVGGAGSDVFVVANKTVDMAEIYTDFPTLKFVGGEGIRPYGEDLRGIKGNDLNVYVPPGVIIEDDYGYVLGEVARHGDRFLVSRGGQGWTAARSRVAQQVEGHHVILNLKTVSDIGLIGFPNSGKSTLFKAISDGMPKIDSHPFTTIFPELGTIDYSDGHTHAVVDLPGLMKGADERIGCGDHFLKHIENSKLLLFLVDLHGFQLSSNHPHHSPIQMIIELNKELEKYSENLLDKPCLLVLNKTESGDAQDQVLLTTQEQVQNIEKIVSELDPFLDRTPNNVVKFDETFVISAKSGYNVDYLKERLHHWLSIYYGNEEDPQTDNEDEQSLDIPVF